MGTFFAGYATFKTAMVAVSLIGSFWAGHRTAIIATGQAAKQLGEEFVQVLAQIHAARTGK